MKHIHLPRFSGIDRPPPGGIGRLHLVFPELLVLAGQLAYRLLGRLARLTVTVAGVEWSYLDGGRGEAVVFVHGFGADKYRFGPMAPLIGRSHRVVIPDLPGFGESTKSVSLPYDIVSQTRRLADFIDAVVPGRFHLVGLSMGGYIAALYAADRPQRLLSLALIDAAGVRPPQPSVMMQRFAEEGKVLLLYRNRSEFEELLDALFYRPPWIPGPIKDFSVRQALNDFEIRRKVLTDILGGGAYLLDPRLKEIAVPTLVLWGADDRIVDRSSVEVFSRGIPDSRAVVFEQCGHIPIIEKWRESCRVYQGFLADVKRSAPIGGVR